MNTSNVSHMNSNSSYIFFKGVYCNLAPVTLPLCILVLVQNIVIFVDYFKERSKFVSSMFMGIALADVLKAQGQLVLTVISLLVFTGYVDIMVLYNSIFFYMLTALPGVNCSKLFNVVLSICLAINMADPFRRLNTTRVRRIVICICSIIVLLHLLDTGIVIYVHLKIYTDKSEYQYTVIYLWTMIIFDPPGLIAILMLLCSIKDGSGERVCIKYVSTRSAILITYALVYYVLPALMVLICMIIQIRYLRRSLQESETLPDTSRHVSITVFLVSTLFFVCHTSVFIGSVVWMSLHTDFVPDRSVETDDHTLLMMGLGFGFAKFTLPLIYAVAYPIIIICRKPELKEKYVRYLRRVTQLCRSTDVRGEE